MICVHCKRDPGTKPNGVWKGFLDKDTGQLVCWKCQARHYREKFKDPELAHQYSEMPVIGVPTQLRIQLK